MPLLANLLLAGHGLFRTFACACVGVGALTVNRKATAMTQPLVTANFHLALDVLRHLTAKVALYLEVLLDVATKLGDLCISEIPNSGGLIDLGGFTNMLGLSTANPIDVRE